MRHETKVPDLRYVDECAMTTSYWSLVKAHEDHSKALPKLTRGTHLCRRKQGKHLQYIYIMTAAYSLLLSGDKSAYITFVITCHEAPKMAMGYGK